MVFNFSIFQFKKLVCLFERVRGIVHLLAHLPKSHNGLGSATPKPVSRNFFQVSHTDAGAQTLGPSSAALSGALAEIWIRSRAAGAQTGTIWNASLAGDTLMCYTTVPAPIYNFKSILLYSLQTWTFYRCYFFLKIKILTSQCEGFKAA